MYVHIVRNTFLGLNVLKNHKTGICKLVIDTLYVRPVNSSQNGFIKSLPCHNLSSFAIVLDPFWGRALRRLYVLHMPVFLQHM
jgi:hypothetical protein